MTSPRPYRPNPDFFHKLALGPELRKALREVAERGKRIAEDISESFRVTGEYAGSFEISEETLLHWEGRYKGPRAAVRLINTAPYAAAVEWGKGGRSGEETQSNHRVLGRTLDQLKEPG